MNALMARSIKQQNEKDILGMISFATSLPCREVESKSVADGRGLHAPGALELAHDTFDTPNPVVEVRP